MEDIRKASEEANPDPIFVAPPEFQSSPLDLNSEMKTSENGATFLEPFNVSQTNKRKEDLFQISVEGQSTPVNGDLHNISLKTPDYFSTDQTQTQNLSEPWQGKSSDVLKVEEDLFHTARGGGSVHTDWAKEVNPFDKSSSNFVDPFKSPLDQDDLFQTPQTVAADLFYTPTTTELQNGPAKGDRLFPVRESKQDTAAKDKDLFGMSSMDSLDIFSSSSTNTVDLFQSPLPRNLFQDVSSLDDPFSPTPSKPHDHLFRDVPDGTPDLFQPRPSETKQSRDTFEVIPFKTTFFPPSVDSPSQMKLDVPTSTDPLKKSKSPPAIPPKPSHRPQGIVLTTPQGSKHDILQPTPFIQASGLSASPSQSPADMDHVQIFRRPPRPLPRSRPPRPVKPPQPVTSVETQPDVPKTSPKPSFKGLPKPVIPRKPRAQEDNPVEPDNSNFFEDILLIGQERCVDDWPEDSPQHQPDFKPSGKFKLRRESLKAQMDADGGSGEDHDGAGSHGKKKEKKFRMSLLPRRNSKDKFPDDLVDGKSNTLPRKSSKEYFSSTGENEDEEQYGMDYKKKPLKTKVNQLFRRASTTSAVFEGKHRNGLSPQESKDAGKKDSVRRKSEGARLEYSTGEEEGGDAHCDEKRKKKMKIKFVPQRGFSISMEKSNEEPKGAHGYTPRKGSKDKSYDEVLESHGYTPREKFQDDDFEDIEEIKSQSLQSANTAAFMDDEHLHKTHRYSPRLNEDEDAFGIQDHKPKKTTKSKLLHAGRRSSKEGMLDSTITHRKKSSFSAEELDEPDLNKMEDCKPKKVKHKAPPPVPRKPAAASGHGEPRRACNDGSAEDEDFAGSREVYDEDPDEVDTCKEKKPLKMKVFRKKLEHKVSQLCSDLRGIFVPHAFSSLDGRERFSHFSLSLQSKSSHVEDEDPPGAASGDYMSEAALAEWLAAQKDELAMEGLEDEDEEGDTDSLMEWWYTVEKWDEVPSDEEDTVIKEDESKSFTILADKVHRGLRLFNKVFMERAEVLWQSIILLHTIADDISEFHQKAKIAGITGGTTTAVGGVTAIAGLALAPFTFGASLVITAVGVGVATAGGITSASAAISDNVNNMQDRKKVEAVLKEYEGHLLDIGKILHFANQGLFKLRGHPFLRSGTQHYSEDWEVRMAVQMIGQVDSSVMRATELTDTAVSSLQGLFKGMDKYFTKDTRELKKGCKKEIVAQIRDVANVLNENIVELNTIREDLQDATGSM
ncbi:uncharacterized protein [Leuresthes tenuis]|uniref:uncharacterized protein n=1 Tax=Leuresthes tenuis TaxID=355514 RepID=UPI003B51402C